MRKQGKQTLKQLQTIWYKKLAKEGFVDIEEPNSPLEMLKRWDGNYFWHRAQWRGANTILAQRDYYHQCYQFQFAHTFKSKLEQSAWALYADGYPKAQIAKQLKVPLSKINTIIKNLLPLLEAYVKVEQSY